jgi:hypothetical protein
MKGIKIDNPESINGYVAFHYIEETALWYLFTYNNFEVKLLRQVQGSGGAHIIILSNFAYLRKPFYRKIVQISLDDLSEVYRFVDFIQAECHKIK